MNTPSRGRKLFDHVRTARSLFARAPRPTTSMRRPGAPRRGAMGRLVPVGNDGRRGEPPAQSASQRRVTPRRDWESIRFGSKRWRGASGSQPILVAKWGGMAILCSGLTVQWGSRCLDRNSGEYFPSLGAVSRVEGGRGLRPNAERGKEGISRLWIGRNSVRERQMDLCGAHSCNRADAARRRAMLPVSRPEIGDAL